MIASAEPFGPLELITQKDRQLGYHAPGSLETHDVLQASERTIPFGMKVDGVEGEWSGWLSACSSCSCVAGVLMGSGGSVLGMMIPSFAFFESTECYHRADTRSFSRD
jgi:hypothetical protein